MFAITNLITHLAQPHLGVFIDESEADVLADMQIDLTALPEDSAVLQSMIRDAVGAALQRDAQVSELTAEIEKLQALIQKLLRHRFGRRSEQLSPDQLKLKAVVLLGTLTGLLIWAGGFYLLFALSLSDFERALVVSLMTIFSAALLVLGLVMFQLTERVAALEALTQINTLRPLTDAKVRA